MSDKTKDVLGGVAMLFSEAFSIVAGFLISLPVGLFVVSGWLLVWAAALSVQRSDS